MDAYIDIHMEESPDLATTEGHLVPRSSGTL